MKNIIAFQNFIEILDSKEELRNGDCAINAIITYHWKSNKTEVESLRVVLRRTTFEAGRINIDDGKRINPVKFHLDFDPTHQAYTFDEENKKLIIEGESDKMGGKYLVEISEN
jgi:hypothetical protein